MEKIFRRNKLMIYGFVALLAVLTCVVMPVNYNVNDDVELEGILSGMYTGVPDGHAIYIQAVLAYPISWLYRMFPAWNWYGILLVGLQWLSLGLVMDRVDDCVADPVNRILFLGNIVLAFFIAVWENYVSLTYTTTAGILLAMVMFWYLAGDSSLRTQMITAFLVLIGISLRFQFVPMILPIGGICWVLKAYREGIRKVWYLPAFLAAGLFVMAGCRHIAYQSEDWQEFLKFNDARTEVYDYSGVPSYETDREFYDTNGISVQVFEALDIYDLTGRPEVTTELLRTVADYQQQKYALSAKEEVKQALKSSLMSFFMDQYGQSLSPLNIFMFLLWMGFFITGIYRKKYACLLTGLSAAAAMGAMWFYLAWKGRLLYRVLFVMQLLMITTGAGLWRYAGRGMFPNRMTRRYLLTAAFVLMIVPSLLTFQKCYEHAVEAKEQNADRDALEAYFKEHPDQFYLVTTPLVAPVSDSITLHTNGHPMNYAELGGWIVRSPLYMERLANAGVTDIRQMLLDQKGCVITSGRDMSYLFSDEYVENEEIEYRCLEDLNGEDWKYYIYQYILLE